MNYLAQGINQGWATGYDAVQKKRDRKDRREETAAERALRIELDAKRAALEKQLQDDRLVHDAKRQFSEQGWRSGESEKDRGWRSSERTASQGFQAGEGEKDRGWRSNESAAERAAREDLQQRQLDQAAAQFGKSHELRREELSMQDQMRNAPRVTEDLDPVTGDVNSRRVTRTLPPSAAAGAGAVPGAGAAAGNKAAPRTITSKAEYDALPSGAAFIWNGRPGRKP